MTEFGKEYGEALYDLCLEEGLSESVREQVAALDKAFREGTGFLRLLDNLSLGKEERIAILDETLKGKVHPYVLNFLRLLTERGAATLYRDCASAFEKRYQQDHRAVEAEVTTAKPLTAEQREKLKEKIREMTGREAALKEKVDPGVLGGVLLKMDGKRFDNTVKSRLTAIRRAMTED